MKSEEAKRCQESFRKTLNSMKHLSDDELDASMESIGTQPGKSGDLSTTSVILTTLLAASYIRERDAATRARFAEIRALAADAIGQIDRTGAPDSAVIAISQIARLCENVPE